MRRMDNTHGRGKSGNDLTIGTTILEGIKRASVASNASRFSVTGEGASGCDAAVLVIGEKPYAEMIGDPRRS